MTADPTRKDKIELLLDQDRADWDSDRLDPGSQDTKLRLNALSLQLMLLEDPGMVEVFLQQDVSWKDVRSGLLRGVSGRVHGSGRYARFLDKGRSYGLGVHDLTKDELLLDEKPTREILAYVSRLPVSDRHHEARQLLHPMTQAYITHGNTPWPSGVWLPMVLDLVDPTLRPTLVHALLAEVVAMGIASGGRPTHASVWPTIEETMKTLFLLGACPNQPGHYPPHEALTLVRHVESAPNLLYLALSHNAHDVAIELVEGGADWEACWDISRNSVNWQQVLVKSPRVRRTLLERAALPREYPDTIPTRL